MSELESYAHKLAKQVLMEWINDAPPYKNSNDSNSFTDLNNIAYAVYDEYPVMNFMLPNGYPLWNENTDWENLIYEPHGFHVHPQTYILKEGITKKWPTYQQVKQHFKGNFVILDIAAEYKGWISWGIEVVHKHPVPDSKAKFLSKCEFPIYEVKADWVLSQVQPPSHLVCTRKFGGDYSNANIRMWNS